MIKFVSYIVKFFFIFFVLYDVNFKFLPGVTSARVSFAMLLVYFIYKWVRSGARIDREFFYKNSWYISSLIFIFSFTIIQNIFSGDITQSARLTYFTMYGILVPFFIVGMLENKNSFFVIIGIAVLLQSIITLGSYLNPLIKETLNSLVLYNANFDTENKTRALGFVSVAGAGFSLIQFSGVFAFLAYMRLNSISAIKQLLCWVSIIIIIFSVLFIGRTGLFLSLLSVFLYLISYGFSLKKIFVGVIAIFFLIQLDFVSILENLTSNIEGYDSELFVAWIESGFKLNNDLVEGLSAMPIPPLSVETIIGTGLVADPNGMGNASGHDTGYIQSYYSFGLLGAILFYLTYYYFLFSYARKSNHVISYLLILILVLVESKEFFIFSYAFPFFVFSFLLFMAKDQSSKLDLKQLKAV